MLRTLEGMPSNTVTRSESLAELERQVSVLLRRIKKVVAVRAHLVHPDIQSASYLMLGWLDEHGPVRASEMADQFHVDKGAISRQLQHLEELGLVERDPDPADGRATLVRVTAEAVRRLQDANADRRRWLDGRLADWSADRLARFAAELDAYNQALE
jgi:DNA-binding MarR family transcriptional regulator